MKKVNVFCHSFQKVKLFQAFFYFDDYGLQIMKTPNSVSQKIRVLNKITKKGYFKHMFLWLSGRALR